MYIASILTRYDYVYGLPFHAVVVFRPKMDFLFKSASTYCTAAHDNNANPNPPAASCKSALRSMRLYIAQYLYRKGRNNADTGV